jgi:hypothetical protein
MGKKFPILQGYIGMTKGVKVFFMAFMYRKALINDKNFPIRFFFYDWLFFSGLYKKITNIESASSKNVSYESIAKGSSQEC